VGGFGEPAASRRSREATVAVRWRNGARIQVVAASHIGWRRDEYRFESPGDRDPDYLDHAWAKLEGDLRQTIARLESRRQVPSDLGTVFAYIAGAGVRHPSFREHARRERLSRGEKAPVGDAVQLERIRTLQGSFEILDGWVIRVLHRPADGPPFLVSDFGWCRLTVVGRGPTTCIFPLSSECAVMAYPREPELGPGHAHGVDAHFTLVPSAMDVVNSTAWCADETSWVAIHPAYQGYLGRLEELEAVQWPRLGPYRGRHGDLFD
jgi:hypothetical protein